VNLKKYKRFFAFGCSMTGYNWPTWADIIATEFEESYNYGKSGAGNLFISNAIVEANKIHKFNENDLVIMMWTSVSREDRYKDGYWHTPGNIYSQGEISNKFVKQWADTRFYLLRDFALIDLTKEYLKSTNCKHFMLNMAPFVDIQHSSGDLKYKEGQDIFNMYADTLSIIQPDICTTVYKGIWPTIKIKGYGGEPYDYHPTPLGYLSYIRKIFPALKITDRMKDLAQKYTDMIEVSNELSDVASIWYKERKIPPSRI